MSFAGVGYALAAALLFGLAAPVAKLLVGRLDPILLAGLFYLASGVGLALLRLLISGLAGKAEAPLTRADLPWLAGAILCGGIAGPILLMLGLARTGAAAASLLLTLESVATALIAWFVFRENFDRRIAAGMLTIALGAVVLAWQSDAAVGDRLGPLLIAAACLAWGLDNNLTRKVALADPLQIAMLKGLVAGPVTIAIAVTQGAALPAADLLLAAATVGLLGYGVSLALFILGLRHLGTARTGAYFATAPFIGAVAAVPLLGEAVTWQLMLAGGFIVVGVWLHLTERHEHEHEHEPLEHAHAHVHDDHHSHAHCPEDPPGEPHVHAHVHGRLRHSHAHVPDSHHRHSH